MRWLLGLEPKKIKVLKTELSLEPIHADAVIFWLIGNQILHIEFQTLPQSSPSIPLRMLDYSVRLKRRYGRIVVQIVIFLQPTTNPVAFTEEYRDETTVHRYRVIRLWEQESAPFLANPALLPLAVLTKTDSPRTLLAQVAERVASIPNLEERLASDGLYRDFSRSAV